MILCAEKAAEFKQGGSPLSKHTQAEATASQRQRKLENVAGHTFRLVFALALASSVCHPSPSAWASHDRT